MICTGKSKFDLVVSDAISYVRRPESERIKQELDNYVRKT